MMNVDGMCGIGYIQTQLGLISDSTNKLSQFGITTFYSTEREMDWWLQEVFKEPHQNYPPLSLFLMRPLPLSLTQTI